MIDSTSRIIHARGAGDAQAEGDALLPEAGEAREIKEIRGTQEEAIDDSLLIANNVVTTDDDIYSLLALYTYNIFSNKFFKEFSSNKFFKRFSLNKFLKEYFFKWIYKKNFLKNP